MNTPRSDSDRKAEDRARKALRQNKNARATAAPVSVLETVVEGATVAVRGATLYVSVRDTETARDAMSRWCHYHNVLAQLSADASEPGEPELWRMVGDPAALALLADDNHMGRVWWVKGVQLGMNVRVGGRAAGAGELSEGAKRRGRESRALRLKDDERKPTVSAMDKALPAVYRANGVERKG